MKNNKNIKASKWIIYSNGIGGWFAWNGYTKKQKNLIINGHFSKAVDNFELLIGPYYESRGI